MLKRALQLVSALASLAAPAGSSIDAESMVIRTERLQNHRPKPIKLKPGHDARGKIGKRNKASSAAQRANLYGKQSHAGKEFISYAEHDRRNRLKRWPHAEGLI